LIDHKYDPDELPGLIEAIYKDSKSPKSAPIYRLPQERAKLLVEALAKARSASIYDRESLDLN
jgi:hypothetical protein